MRASNSIRRWLLRCALAALCGGYALAESQLSCAQTRFHQPTPPAAFIPAQPLPQPAAAATPAVSQPTAASAPAPAGVPNPQLQDVLAAAIRAAGLSNSTTSVQSEALPSPLTGPAPIAQPDQSLLIPLHGGMDSDQAVVKDNENGLISLMVRQGSLRQVVAMIGETQKLNIVFAGPDDAQVTASFDRQPWQNVLDSLLSASSYTWTTRGNVIFVSRVDAGSSIPPGAEGREVEVFELDFASAIDIDQTVKGLLSPAGQSWVVETSSQDNRRTREVVAVVDYPAYLGRISDYICQADQPPRQVLVEAHILQVELSDDCRNGINFNNLISFAGSDITLKSVGFANPAATSAFFIDQQGTGLDGLVELLKNTTDAKTLASPKLLVVSGQESHIQIGEKLGYRVTTTTQTSTLESVQFLDVGVVLRVIPRVTRDGRVIMRVMPKVSTGQVVPDTGLPSERTAETETDVLLRSGQGMVIGGLIQERDSNVQSKLPLLGDIPYLGILFQKRQVIKSRNEIIVTLQPRVLPYCPIDQAHNDAEFVRTIQPLTERAIHSYPRPYEPRMPDTFNNHCRKQRWQDWWCDEDILNYVGEGPPCDIPGIQQKLEELPALAEPIDAIQDETASEESLMP